MEKDYTLKIQRSNFLITLQNDLVLKAQDRNERYFEQIGAGRRAFKNLWGHLWFRLSFNILLPLLMVVGDIYQPLRDTVKYVRHRKKTFSDRRLFVGHNRQLFNISKRAGLQKEDDAWLRLPDDNYILPEPRKTFTVFDFISLGEIFKSAYQAVLIHLAVVFQIGYDKYFLSYKAYNWCLTDFAMRHIPKDVELVFCYICDRRAILIDKLNNTQKSMVQHGTMHFGTKGTSNPYMEYHSDRGFCLWKGLYKSSPSTVYCYTDDDEWALANSVIANSPKYIHMGYGFKPAFKPDKKSILIVANYDFLSEKEEEIIRQLQVLDIIIYLKNHPAIANSLYDEMRKRYQFVFIEGVETRLPDVDLVISYDSTLAYEYASIGTRVLYYGRFDVSDIANLVKNELRLG